MKIWVKIIYLMKGAFSESAGIQGALLLNHLVAVEQHFDMCVRHSASTSRDSESAFFGLKIFKIRDRKLLKLYVFSKALF